MQHTCHRGGASQAPRLGGGASQALTLAFACLEMHGREVRP